MASFDHYKAPNSQSWTKPPISEQLLVNVKGLSINDSNPIVLVDLKINADVSGFLCKTSLEMTFLNPSNRQLEGELMFPMPEDAVVSGYALDVNGVLVEASLVEKEKATKVFEAEIKKGVDPGLVEHVKGNNFKTRIYPLPANGKRTVRVTYVSHLSINADNETIYYVPLLLKEPVATVSINIVTLGNEPPAFLNGEFESHEFESVELSSGDCMFSSNYNATDFMLEDSALLVILPTNEGPVVALERDDSDEIYFMIRDVLPDLDTSGASSTSDISKICVLWDASLSRYKDDISRDYEFLTALLTTIDATVDIILFRHEMDDIVSFHSSNIHEIINFLQTTDYDGGTRFDNIDLENASEYNYILFFTDGMSSIGPDNSPLTARDRVPPIYTIASSPNYNAQLLKYNAFSTGGQYFHLSNYGDLSAIIAQIGVPVFSFVNIESTSGEITEIYPSMTIPLSEKSFTITGKLSSPSADIQINYGYGINHITHTFKTQLSSEVPASTGLVPIMWAQKKIEELSVFSEENKERIIELGRQFNIVTPGTSLIVLESLEQHIEHKIQPHVSRTELYNQYQNHLQQILTTKAQKINSKLNTVYSWWSGRVDWWNRKFEIPKPKEKSKLSKKKKSRAREETVSLPLEGFALQSDEELDMAMDFDDRMEELSAPPPPPMMSRSRSAAPPPPGASRSPIAQQSQQQSQPARDVGASVSVKFWDPSTPYLNAIKQANGDIFAKYQVYMAQREEYIDTPAFYIDCAHWFIHNEGKNFALRILTNIPELKLESHQLLRMLGYKLDEIGALELASLIFQKVKELRPDEPQSSRDLGLVYDQLGEYQKAIELLWDVVIGEWNESFSQIELTALYEMNNIIAKCNGYPDQGKGQKEIEIHQLDMPSFFDKRFLKNLDVDLRISMAWDTDNTDMDLHVIEPTGEEAYYAHSLTRIGGQVSRDFTRGYGPEEYMLKVAMPGTYDIKTNYFGSSQASLTGPTTLLLMIYTNYGRPDETLHKSLVRLGSSKDNNIIGSITV